MQREGQLPGEEIPAEDDGGPLEHYVADEEAPHDEAGEQGDVPPEPSPPA